ncbi:putative M18 family aminopeptidase 2 [Nitrospina gracilis 3/211]|uniref:M18 family aminopeptidase n=1 Tax=Nitrospina gracilis (strain 3/211) TaxID=1266370 RepID=M1YKA5_NITG3|nr:MULTISPECIES: M18 family aminopeptidase [Nitrospina]MCF8723804.1 aspartyl aminopeptidase [Nitrospina sp. Nb-3]CCQ90911.1 putative M18 family aminopeptidase 2 [Nitrospina gracilis 3/211]
MTASASPHRPLAEALLEYIDASPTPYHAVAETVALLKASGFSELKEEDAWSPKPGARHYVVRNGTSIVAFVTGTRPPEETGFKIVGAHTDSPNLRLKPHPAYEKNGYGQLGVEVYGGVLLTTWTDRDLSLAGRVMVQRRQGPAEPRLVKFDRPLLRIPQLAIHLNRNVNDQGLVLNKQSHLPPVFMMAEKSQVTDKTLRQLVSKAVKCKPEEILSQDLMLFDTQPSSFAGAEEEFLFAPRLDNLASCHAALRALVDAPKKDASTRLVVFYDNEEVGSETAQGGGSPFLKDTLERLAMQSKQPREAFLRAVAKSLFISADMAHAVHPNYADQHDIRHMPLLNRGPVIKSNAGQRYATDGETGARFELLCKKAKVAVQKFVMRSDLACGSTIGPITAANLGIRTVDVGNPMLSMHSVREMAGAHDHADMVRVLKEFFRPE